MKKVREVKKEFRQLMDEIKIVDNHDHLSFPFLPEISFEMDLPYFLTHPYMQGDLVSSGMPEKFLAPEKYRYLEKPCGKDKSEQR